MEDETTRNCVICTSTINFGHLGIDSCRACAAFFKRCQTSGKRYPCRQGNGKCAFRKHQKFKCRSCRYDKCVEFGMTVDLVLPEFSKTSSNSTVDITNRPSVIRKTMESNNTNDSVLENVRRQYNAAYCIRIEKERDYLMTADLQRIDHPSEEFFVCNVNTYYELYGTLIAHAVALFRNISPIFEDTQISLKSSLFKSFLAKFVMVESFYLSAKYFNEANYLFCSLLTCFDCKNLDLWLTSKISADQQRDFLSSLKGFAVDYVDLLLPTLKIGTISEKEFHSLIALAFCDVDTSELNDEVVKEVDDLRKRTFRELHVYYSTEMRIVDYSQRLGNLMTVAHMAHEAGRIVHEEFRTYAAMFDLYTHDSLLREIFFN